MTIGDGNDMEGEQNNFEGQRCVDTRWMLPSQIAREFDFRGLFDALLAENRRRES